MFINFVEKQIRLWVNLCKVCLRSYHFPELIFRKTPMLVHHHTRRKTIAWLLWIKTKEYRRGEWPACHTRRSSNIGGPPKLLQLICKKRKRQGKEMRKRSKGLIVMLQRTRRKKWSELTVWIKKKITVVIVWGRTMTVCEQESSVLDAN